MFCVGFLLRRIGWCLCVGVEGSCSVFEVVDFRVGFRVFGVVGKWRGFWGRWGYCC